MTRAERENLIRAYFEGKMSSHEEHDFFINVALDAELRTELKAHRTIEDAFRKDREVDPGDILQLQGAVMAALAAAPFPMAPATAPGNTAPGNPAPGNPAPGNVAPDAPASAGSRARGDDREPATMPGKRGWRLPASIALSLLAVFVLSMLITRNASEHPAQEPAPAIQPMSAPAGGASSAGAASGIGPGSGTASPDAASPDAASPDAASSAATPSTMLPADPSATAPTSSWTASPTEASGVGSTRSGSLSTDGAERPRQRAADAPRNGARNGARDGVREGQDELRGTDASRQAEQPVEVTPKGNEDSLGIGIDLRIGGGK